MRRRLLLILVASVAAAAAAAYVLLGQRPERPAVAADPRTNPPLVMLAEAKIADQAVRSFTGTVASRVQSNLGFRVSGKIVERLVDVGQQVKQGQALMRIDQADLQLALTAKRNAVIAARAVTVQAEADEKRYALLVKDGVAATPQRYEQAKAALDTATAQLAAAEAEARLAENAIGYSVLVADADGTIVDSFADPGQVVAAGQTVLQLAQAGPREAVVWLPETMRPPIGSEADAIIYGRSDMTGGARLRQISDSADPQTRTYQARYVLDGAAASAPLGSTVTVKIRDEGRQSEVGVPVGALLDDGLETGVWVFRSATSTVEFTPVAVKSITAETAFVTGIGVGDQVVALGAHLLEKGETVRSVAQQEARKL